MEIDCEAGGAVILSSDPQATAAFLQQTLQLESAAENGLQTGSFLLKVCPSNAALAPAVRMICFWACGTLHWRRMIFKMHCISVRKGACVCKPLKRADPDSTEKSMGQDCIILTFSRISV